MTRIYVIGIGYKPLTKKAAEIVSRSAVIFASPRLEEVFVRYAEYEDFKERLRVIDAVAETMSVMKHSLAQDSTSAVTLLASGDPMFFGIGRRVVEEFGRDAVEIIPDLSSVQVAFALIKEPWTDAFMLSLHGGPDPNKRRELEHGIEDIPLLLEEYGKIAILTDGINNPSVIARSLAETHLSAKIIIYVCEKLGYPEERVVTGTAEEIASQSFAEPNVVIMRSLFWS